MHNDTYRALLVMVNAILQATDPADDTIRVSITSAQVDVRPGMSAQYISHNMQAMTVH